MTQQRAQVWLRKDQLTTRLHYAAATDAQKRIRELINDCNQSLVTDVFTLPSEPTDIQPA